MDSSSKSIASEYMVPLPPLAPYLDPHIEKMRVFVWNRSREDPPVDDLSSVGGSLPLTIYRPPEAPSHGRFIVHQRHVCVCVCLSVCLLQHIPFCPFPQKCQWKMTSGISTQNMSKMYRFYLQIGLTARFVLWIMWKPLQVRVTQLKKVVETYFLFSGTMEIASKSLCAIRIHTQQYREMYTENV